MISTDTKSVATCAGIGVVAAITINNIATTGGAITPSIMYAALGCGVIAAARALGEGKMPWRYALAMGLALAGGEVFNLQSTIDHKLTTAEEAQAPFRALQKKHDDAEAELKKLQGEAPASKRVELAQAALADAKAGRDSQRVALAREALKKAERRRDEKCYRACETRSSDVTKAAANLQSALTAAGTERTTEIATAQAEVTAALAAAATDHAAAIAKAEAAVAANPKPRSATPTADRLGWAPWFWDLSGAVALSLGANLLAGMLLAFGAMPDFAPAGSDIRVSETAPDRAPAKPGRGSDGRNGGTDRPKRTGPKGGPSDPKPVKAEIFDYVQQCMAEGSDIPSQQFLADKYKAPKTSVSDWMRDWRKKGLIPAATINGRCKATVSA